jgi:DNA polymerase (family 10)
MRNADIADTFAELADRLALTDLKPYRYMAYRKAESIFRDLGESVAVLSEEGRLTEIDGIGPAIEEKVASLLTEGTFPALERAREEVPDALLALTRLPGVGPATAKKVYAATDGEGIDSLAARAAAGELEVGDGITRKVIDALAELHAHRAAGGGDEKRGAFSGIPLDAAGQPLPGPWFRRDQVQSMLVTLAELLAPIGPSEPTGAYARGCELVTGLDVLVEGEQAAVADALGARGYEVAGDDAFVSPSGMPLRVIAVPSIGADARAEHAGPAEWTATKANAGVPIELRDAVLAGRCTAAEAAARELVTAAELRGELHAHSDWSDGKATILDMARAARARGDEYFCVTDHSAPYAMVGGLTPERLLAQADEVARANETLQREHEEQGEPAFRVLRGTELEILADGTLGLPDAALARLDWVVASIHTQQRQAPDVILERMRRVLDNPLVDAIGHPTSRRLLIRDRTALDVDALIAMALDHDVVLEINANPDRLDLDSEHAAAALAAGVRLTVNTDAHRTRTLALREHGIAVARRAGARVVDVVNCLPADELLASRRRHR